MRPSKKNDLTRPNAETPLLDLATIKSSEALKIEITTSHTELTLSGPAWSLRWAAPEVLAGGDPDLPSDIWAFGWVCWEVSGGCSAGEPSLKLILTICQIITGKLPFQESNHEPAIVFKVIRGQLPWALDDDQASQIVRLSYLMTACWVSDALKRPSSRYCREEIYSMVRCPSRLENRDLTWRFVADGCPVQFQKYKRWKNSLNRASHYDGQHGETAGQRARSCFPL